MLELISEPSTWIAFATLSALEIVLGIDNIIFISVLVGRLPPERRDRARIVGLALAMVSRILLLFSIVWLTKLTAPLFTFVKPISGRDLVLFFGGLFLLAKSVTEIHHTLEGVEEVRKPRVFANFAAIVTQIAIIDIIFSLDSVFTAVGLANPDQVLDQAINQTLSRTIMTKVVTSIVVVALLLLGGSALRGFSEALLIGIIAGTYSSIYISSSIALSFGLKAEHVFPPVRKDELDEMP